MVHFDSILGAGHGGRHHGTSRHARKVQDQHTRIRHASEPWNWIGVRVAIGCLLLVLDGCIEAAQWQAQWPQATKRNAINELADIIAFDLIAAYVDSGETG